MRVNTRYINSTEGTSSSKDAPQWRRYPPFQAHSEMLVCKHGTKSIFYSISEKSPLTSSSYTQIAYIILTPIMFFPRTSNANSSVDKYPHPHPSSPRAHFHVVGMLQFMSDIKKPSLPSPFYSVLMFISVFIMTLSAACHSTNSPDKSLFSHSVLPVLSLCLVGPFNYISFYENLLQP